MFVIAKGIKAEKSQMKVMGTIKIVALLYDVAVNEIPELNGSAVQVNVPEKGLSVIFIKKLLCKGFVGE
jgi:hypothetical protein